MVRDGKNLKGRFLGIVLGSVGKGRLESAFDNAVKAVRGSQQRGARLMTSTVGSIIRGAVAKRGSALSRALISIFGTATAAAFSVLAPVEVAN